MAFIGNFSPAASFTSIASANFTPSLGLGGFGGLTGLGGSQSNPLAQVMEMVQEMLQTIASLSASWGGLAGGSDPTGGALNSLGGGLAGFGSGLPTGFGGADLSGYGGADLSGYGGLNSTLGGGLTGFGSMPQQCLPSPLGAGSNPYGSLGGQNTVAVPVPVPVPVPVAVPADGTQAGGVASPAGPTPGVLTDEGKKRLADWNQQMRDEGAQTFHPTNPDVIDAINNGDMQAAHRFGRHHGDPLTLDLNGDGIKTSDSKINFDMGGDGKQSSINDIAQGDGTLVIGSGKDGSQLLGDKTDLSKFGGSKGFSDGFDALKGLADLAAQKGMFDANEMRDYQNGTLDAGALDVLGKNFGLGIKKDSLKNDAQSLASAGVSSIQIGGAKTTTENFDGKGNNLETAAGAGFTRTDGTSGAAGDLWMQLNPATR